MTDDDLEQARSALRTFMSDMKRWELGFYHEKLDAVKNGRDATLIDNQGRKELSEVLEKWSLQDKTNQGRLIDLGCSDPSTYDPDSDIEGSAEFTDGDAIFTIHQKTGLQTISRFTLNLESGAWKIKRKEFLNYKDKWQRSVL
ncbi:RhsIA family immunity protein [Luteibacter anthropi]|uniref:NTF2 fold immunity protein n=1 Tax=Luteibacter anthropi TaxID=564369 RepID=UPI00203282E3|nr:NTF2 fold immunity protein [Luteibacter anthropi]URX61439.1 RhsIA family immunity protein [Luteibacter anthropi]